MLYAEEGREQDIFIYFVEHALGILSKGEYSNFLSLFDDSRLIEQDLILALRYLDDTRPILKIDNPVLIKNKQQKVYFYTYTDGSGYHMDYDLTTNGKYNDLTIQVEFIKKEKGYFTMLDDLHTL